MKKIMISALLIAFAGIYADAEDATIEFHPDIRFSLADGDYVAEDGDSFWIGIHRIRLHGIDTIEATQRCWLDGQDYRLSRANNALPKKFS